MPRQEMLRPPGPLGDYSTITGGEVREKAAWMEERDVKIFYYYFILFFNCFLDEGFLSLAFLLVVEVFLSYTDTTR